MKATRFACEARCGFEAPLTDVVYRCPDCRALLDVVHEPGLLRSRSAGAWKAIFAERWGAVRLPQASGIWAKKEWVYPELDDAHIVSLGEGKWPLLPLPRLAKELGLSEVLLKQCGIAATGSFKDLGMTVLVSAVKRMRAEGRPIRAVACASTGDTSAAVSAYCAAAGIPSLIFLPKNKVTLSQLVQPLANGARVLSLDTDFDGCMRIVQEVTAADPSIYLANSMNPLRIEGQKVVGIEVCQQLDWDVPDWFVIPGGNLGNTAALGKGLEMALESGVIARRPRIAVAQAARANPLYRAFQEGLGGLKPLPAQATQATAIQIGNPVSFNRAVAMLKRFDGVVEQASEAELADASGRADREGAFTCPQTGVALAALAKLASAGTIPQGSRVVVVSTAHGLKFPAFKESYHRGALEAAAWANPPIELPADVRAVTDELDRRLG